MEKSKGILQEVLEEQFFLLPCLGIYFEFNY